MRCQFSAIAILAFSLPICHTASAADATPSWIWTTKEAKENETVYFRKTIELTASPSRPCSSGPATTFSRSSSTAKWSSSTTGWEHADARDIVKAAEGGEECRSRFARTNQGGPAAFIGRSSSKQRTAPSRRSSPTTPGSPQPIPAAIPHRRLRRFGLGKPAILGKLGVAALGRCGPDCAASRQRLASHAGGSHHKRCPAFKVELLYSVPKDEQGSWVSLTSDDKGRLIASDQYGGLYRITPGKDAETTKIEKLERADRRRPGTALCRRGQLYVVVNGGTAQGSGLYRVRDTERRRPVRRSEAAEEVRRRRRAWPARRSHSAPTASCT